MTKGGTVLDEVLIFMSLGAGSSRRWILPIIVLSSGGLFVLTVLTIYHYVKKEWTSYKIRRNRKLKTQDHQVERVGSLYSEAASFSVSRWSTTKQGAHRLTTSTQLSWLMSCYSTDCWPKGAWVLARSKNS